MFTTNNEDENKFQLVEEPDPSLSYTYADYLKWKFEEQVELIRGQVFKMGPAPAPRNQQISIRRSSRIFTFLERKECQVFAAPFDVRLPVKNKTKDNEITTVVQPDICISCNETKIASEENIAVFILNENDKYDGAKIYAGNDRIKSFAVKGLTIKLDDIFTK